VLFVWTSDAFLIIRRRNNGWNGSPGSDVPHARVQPDPSFGTIKHIER